jgi:hypothetical protein
MFLNRRGRKLLYLSKRVNGKPKKVYVGTGPLADLLAAELEARKQVLKARAEACAAWKAKAAITEGPLDDLCNDLDQMSAASLLARRCVRRLWRVHRVRRVERT